MYHTFVSLKLKSVNFNQNSWQKVSKQIIKKPTCFKDSLLAEIWHYVK